MFNKNIFKIHYFDPSSITVVGKDRYTKDIVVYIDSEPLPHSHWLDHWDKIAESVDRKLSVNFKKNVNYIILCNTEDHHDLQNNLEKILKTFKGYKKVTILNSCLYEKYGLEKTIKNVTIKFYPFCFMEHNLIKSERKVSVPLKEDFYDKKKLREKHYLTLNFRGKTHRAELIKYLLNNELFVKGLVSLNYVDSDERELKVQWGGGPEINLEGLLPYSVDYDMSDKLDYKIPHYENGDRFIDPHSIEPYQDSYINIVNESWTIPDDWVFLTEKTIKPIMHFQPFIINGQRDSLSKLHKLGFKTFEPFIDESYDKIEEPGERLNAICEEIKRLCSLPIKEVHKNYYKLWDRLEYNYEHLYGEFWEKWFNEYMNCFEQRQLVSYFKD